MIPNILTTVRLIIIPIFAYSILASDNLWLSLGLFLFSGVTDIVDGFIARHFNMITDVGKVYDPLVDKLMQLTAVVCLTLENVIPVWVICFIAVKELAMITIGSILYAKKIVVHSNWYGKFATVFFYAVIFILILVPEIDITIKTGLLSALVAITAFAAIGYLIKLIKPHGHEIYEKKAE